MPVLYGKFKSQSEIDAEYDVERSVPDFTVYARHYVDESRRARSRLRATLDVPYGPTREETLDIFPAGGPAAPVFVFLHGGYWRMLSSKDFSCVALGPCSAGVTTVVVNYALVPQVALDEVTRQARAAVAWVLRHIHEYGGDARRVVLGGHSAGAHLTAMCLLTEWDELYGLPQDPLAGAVLVSGLYDLRPLRYSCMQPQLQFDDGIVQRNSPLFHLRATPTPALVTWGDAESGEFRRQSEAFLHGWRDLGNGARRWEQPGRNHFDAIYDFEDAGSTLCNWVVRAASQVG